MSLKSFGGPEGIRTLDLFHAMEARSQLRHRPTVRERSHDSTGRNDTRLRAVEPWGPSSASYNETMHRLRRCAPVALALLLGITSSSCSLAHLLSRPRI